MPDVKTYTFAVDMTCEGCANAITKVLNRYKGKGISNFEVNLAEKKVTTETTLSAEEITEIIQKTGKKVTLMGERK